MAPGPLGGEWGGSRPPILSFVALTSPIPAGSAPLAGDPLVAPARGIPDEVAHVLGVLPSASVIVSATGDVPMASARAVSLGLVNRSQLAVPALEDLVTQVLSEGEPREQELRVRRPPLGREMLEIRARAALLRPGLVLLLVDDLTEDRRVDAVRRDFVANVSHELKTPVGALSLLSEAILSAADDPDAVRHFGERMQLEATRLSNLIQDVIDLSRLQGDDPIMRAEVVSVEELLVRAIEELRTAAIAQEIEIVRGEPTTALVFGDRTQLLAALRNLIANAVSYSPAHTRVAVDARIVDRLIEISVTDQGVGIPSTDLDRIFERFYRVDPARSRVTGGTGLGLAIVKHVCQNHGGECTVWSEVGVGSTFTLRLPAYEETTNTQATNTEGHQ